MPMALYRCPYHLSPFRDVLAPLPRSSSPRPTHPSSLPRAHALSPPHPRLAPPRGSARARSRATTRTSVPCSRWSAQPYTELSSASVAERESQPFPSRSPPASHFSPWRSSQSARPPRGRRHRQKGTRTEIARWPGRWEVMTQLQARDPRVVRNCRGSPRASQESFSRKRTCDRSTSYLLRRVACRLEAREGRRGASLFASLLPWPGGEYGGMGRYMPRPVCPCASAPAPAVRGVLLYLSHLLLRLRYVSDTSRPSLSLSPARYLPAQP
jgi:hypothetical protein